MADKNLVLKGIPFLRLPITKNNTVNNRSRNVQELGNITSAHLFYECDIMNCRGILYCGKMNKALPLVRYYVRASDRPVVLLTPDEYCYENTGLHLVFEDYSITGPVQSLPKGNGNVYIKDDEAAIDLVRMISDNTDHAFVFCASDGLQIDSGTLTALARTSGYFILTDMLSGAAGSGLKAEELASRAKALFFYPSSDAGRFLIPLLPKYENEKPHNNLAFGYHGHNGAVADSEGNIRMNSGFGINLSQSREISIEPVINEAQLAALRENGQLLIYNAASQRVYTGRITH